MSAVSLSTSAIALSYVARSLAFKAFVAAVYARIRISRKLLIVVLFRWSHFLGLRKRLSWKGVAVLLHCAPCAAHNELTPAFKNPFMLRRSRGQFLQPAVDEIHLADVRPLLSKRCLAACYGSTQQRA